MKTNPFFTAFKPIKVGDKVTIKPEFMDPGDENYTFFAFEDQLEGMNDIKVYATRNADGSRAPGIQSIRFEMLVMEPRGAANTTYATLDEVKAAVAAGAVVHYATPSYTVKQSKFDPEEFFIDCINGHRAYFGKDYKPEDFYSITSLDDQLSNLERDLTGLPNDDPRRVPLENEFRRVKRLLFSTTNQTTTMPTTYADTLEAAHNLQAHFMEVGTPSHSGYSKNYLLKSGSDTYRMTLNPSSNIPIFVMNGSITPAAVVYAALLQI